MRVWIENAFDNLPGEGGRIQRFALMARAFAAAGDAVVLWTSDFSHIRKCRRALSAAAMPSDFEIALVPTRPYSCNVSISRILSHRAYARTWERLARRRAAAEGAPDVLIVATPPLSTGDAALRLRRTWGCRLVVDVMDAWPETFVRLLPRMLRGLAPLCFAPAFAAARRLYRHADLVTGVASRYGELVRQAGAKEYYLAYHGIERPTGEATDSPARATGPVRLVYCGNLGRGYDLATAVRAVACDGDGLSLDIAGAGESEPALKDLARELKVSDRVRFHGYLRGDGLRRLLRSCDIGLVPLSDDTCVGVPYKLADYAAAGLRVVSALGGETAELLARYRCGVTYRGGSTEDLLRAISECQATSESPQGLCELFDARTIYADYVRRIHG